MAYKGWVVRMKKEMNKSAKEDEEIKTYREAYKEKESAEDFTAYGDFDYLQFVPIQSWNQYHDKFLISDWVGQRQTVMLFSIDKADSDEIGSDEGIDSYIIKDKKNFTKGRFHILTMLHLSNEIKDTDIKFAEILLKIRKAISEFIDLYLDNNSFLRDGDILKYDVYGTFSSSEIAIIWSVSQYTDVINILDCLQYLYYEVEGKRQRVFIASYTIVAWNKNYDGSRENDKVQGNALVQIEFSSTRDIGFAENSSDKTEFFLIQNEIKKQLKRPDELKVMSSVGKTDFIVQIPAEALKNELNGEKIVGSKSVILMQEEENGDWLKKVQENKERLKVDILCSESRSKKLNSRLKDYGDICDSIIEEIDPYDLRFEYRELFLLMFGDYKRVISSSVDQKWLEDYEEQFGTIINIISSDIKRITEQKEAMKRVGREDMPDFLGTLSERWVFMTDVMQQQVNHILESGKLFFTSPNSGIGYTAQFDLMLHMYYGIIKTLILNAYGFRNNSWQYRLVPVVTFMNKPVIESKMIYAADNSWETNRLIQFQFPCDAWANPLFYLPYLVHEVYHYIAPYDRVHRNKSFLTIALAEMGTKYFMKISEFAEDKYDLEDSKECVNHIRSLLRHQLHLHISEETNELLLLIERYSYYRDKTFRFDENRPSDMPIYQFEKAFRDWLDKLPDDCNNKLCNWIGTAIRDIETNSESYRLSQKEIDYLDKFDNIMVQFRKSSAFSSGREERSKSVGDLFHYLKEIYPDCAMIKHLGMGVSEYLVQVAVQLSNVRIMPLKLTRKKASDQIQMVAFRVVPIIQYLQDGLELKEYESSFCTLYANTLRTIQIPTVELGRNTDYKTMAKEWFGFFETCFNEYKEEYTAYFLEFKNQINNYYKDMKPVESLHDLYGRYWNILRGEEVDSELAQKELFDLSLKLALEMQNQVSISEMNQAINRSVYKERIPFQETKQGDIQLNPRCQEPVTYVLHDGFGGLMNIMHNIVKKLDDYHNDIFNHHLGHEDLWYRGISDETYHILPSLYRNYVEKNNFVKFDAKTETTNISLEQLQHHLLQRFRYQADGAPEIINQAVYRSSDYLALMQHYLLPTNLLDWSEDVFAALYFALEDYFKHEDDENWQKEGSPAIYFLDPQAYNRARREMIKEVCGENGKSCSRREKCEAFKRQQVLMEEYRELVPNISVQVNEDIMEEYFCAKYVEEDRKGNVHKGAGSGDLLKHPGEGHCEFCKLPVAYYCSRLSPRIRAQSGQFLAFSLDVNPRMKEKKEYEGGKIPSRDEDRLSFDYMALDKIQEYYLNGGANRHPFMLKLVIPEKSCKSLARLLRKFGIKTMKYYPELTNLKN